MVDQLTLDKFLSTLSSKEPVPGGGGASALAGALGNALGQMVANLTIGKAKYADVEEEMKGLAAEGAALRKELIDSIQKDTESFTAYMNALGMPKNTDEEKAARKEAMQNGLKEAAEVPLAVAETALKIFHVAGAVVERGNANAVTDGLVASMMARTAVLSALLNVKINLGSIKDEEFVARMAAKVAELEKAAMDGEKAVMELSALTRDLV